MSCNDGREGRFSDIAGMARESLGSSGKDSCLMCSEAILDENRTGVES